MTVKQPRKMSLSWAQVRVILDAHNQSLQQVYSNCDALKEAVRGELHEGTLTSPVIAQTQSLLALSLRGRLWWLLTGHL